MQLSVEGLSGLYPQNFGGGGGNDSMMRRRFVRQVAKTRMYKMFMYWRQAERNLLSNDFNADQRAKFQRTINTAKAEIQRLIRVHGLKNDGRDEA